MTNPEETTNSTVNEATEDTINTAEEVVNEEIKDDTASEATSEVGDEVASLQQLIEEQKALVTEMDDRYKRLQADFSNFRRRNEKEREELSAVVVQNLIKELLPIIDNFERALAVETSEGDSFYEGVKMIYTQLKETLEKNGLEVIKAKGEKFDPNYHQAVMREQAEDKEDDTITEELQKGYMVKGRVIRPAMVKVVAN